MHRIIVDNNHIISTWAFKAFNVYPQPVDKAFGILDPDGKMIGAILFQNFNGVNVELSYYGPNTLTHGIVSLIARTTLEFFKAARLTVVTSRRNRRLIRGLIKIGFKLEGIQRCFYGHEDTKKNTGVRLAAFKDQLSRVAYGIPDKQKNVV